MKSVFDHYRNHLAEHYSWMFGSFNATVETFIKYFLEKSLLPSRNKLCIDLGCGSGFQSIALAQIGFVVKAIDFCRPLLDELNEKKGRLTIETVEDDLVNFQNHLQEPPELVVCMGDTLTHLGSKEEVIALLQNTFASLSEDGIFLVSYRDLSVPLVGKDRFIPVKSDSEKILTCFVEYQQEFVEVHDLVHRNDGEKWNLHVSSYKKLILPEKWFIDQTEDIGFSIIEKEHRMGMLHIIAKK